MNQKIFSLNLVKHIFDMYYDIDENLGELSFV